MSRHKHWLQFIGIFLSVILSVSSVPLYAFASGTYDTGGAATEEVTASCEYVAKRGEFEKHYLLSDGSFVAVSYPEAIHYRNADGEWEDIDSSLHAEASSSRIVTGDCGTFAASFSTGRSAGRLVSLSNREFSLSWSLSGDGERMVSSSPVLAASSSSVMQARAKISDSITGKPVSDSETFAIPGAAGSVGYSALFADAPEISAEYTVYRNKIEEDIYINSPTDLRSLRMEFDTAGLTAEVRDDGSVEFLDENGEMRFRIGIPYMEDAANEILTDIHVNAEQNGDSCTVTYTPDEEWLSSSERSYPILFDPSVTTDEYNSNIVDTYVAEGDTANHSGEQKLFYGVKSGKIHRVYIKINDLPAIDASMPVYSATMSLTYLTGTKTGKAVEIRKVDSAWSPTTITYANKPHHSALLGSMTFDASKPVTFNLTSDVSKFYDEFNSANNYGYVIKYVDEGDTAPDYNGFWSSEYTTASKRPVLTVTYGYSLPSSLTNGSVYSFQNVGSGSFMTVHDGKDANYTNVYQKNTTIASLTASQKFRLEQVPSTGGYLLRAMCSSNGTNRVVDIQRVGTEPFVKSGNNAYLYTATASKTQQWLLVGVGENEFKIVLRNNMNLALTAYGIADGTSGGTSSTSAGNVFVSTYSDSDYQKWKIYDANGSEVDYISDDVYDKNTIYVINNVQYRKYLRNSNTSASLDGACGFLSSLGQTVRWRVIKITADYYAIRSATDASKYLASNAAGTQVSLSVISSSEQIPDEYLWTIRSNTIRNVKSGKYLYAYGDYPSTCSIGLTNVVEHYSMWAVLPIGYVQSREIQDFSIDSLTVGPGNKKYIKINKTPSDAIWTANGDFVYSLSTQKVSITSDGLVTGLDLGTETILLRHKATGLTKSFPVWVKYSFGMSIQNNDAYQAGCEMHGDDHARAFDQWSDNLKTHLLQIGLVNSFDYRGTNSWAIDFKNYRLPGVIHTRPSIDDVDLMIFTGHGYANGRNKNEGLFQNNCLHFGTTNSSTGHPSGVGTGADSNFTTSDALYFGYNADTKWLITYTCNFLNTHNGDENVMHLLDRGGRLIMGVASKVTIVGNESSVMCEYLKEGASFKAAFEKAAKECQADNPLVSKSHLYRILYYGPDGEGTLNDRPTAAISDVPKTETKNYDILTNPGSIWGIEY